jgi:hypothetical protein
LLARLSTPAKKERIKERKKNHLKKKIMIIINENN